MGAVHKLEPVQDGEREAYLGVTASVRGLAWRDRLDGAAAKTAIAISQRHGLPEILGRVLASRGVGLDAAATALDPTVRALMPDPSTVRDMDKGAARLAQAIVGNEAHRRVRRLRRRRCLLGGADGPFPGGAWAQRAHLHPRPHDRGLRPQPRGHRGAGEGRRPADRHGRLRHHRRRAALDGQGARGRCRRRRSSSVRRAPARRRRRRQSQPAGRPVGPGPPVRGGCGVHAAGGHHARAAPARLLRRRVRRRPICWRCSTSSASPPCATWCRSKASTAPT